MLNGYCCEMYIYIYSVKWIRNENGIKCDTKIKRKLTFMSAGMVYSYSSFSYSSFFLPLLVFRLTSRFFLHRFILVSVSVFRLRKQCTMRAAADVKWIEREWNSFEWGKTNRRMMKTRSLFFSFFTHAIRFLPHLCASNIPFFRIGVCFCVGGWQWSVC